MHRIVTKSRDLQTYQSLHGRKYFSKEEQSAYYKSRQGLEGERKLFNLLRDQLSSDRIPMYGLLLNNYGTIIQLDCLLIFPSKVVLLEVKNHQGEFEFRDEQFYRITNDKYYPNPLHQLQRSDVNLWEILTKSYPGMQLESYVVFVHEEFTLFTEKNSTILLLSQINSFIRTLNKIPGKIQEHHRKLATKLVAAHMTKSPHVELPEYHFDPLKKGVLCLNCRNSLQLFKRELHCKRCSYKENIDSGVLRNVIEFHTLFPDMKITTTNIASWCALGVSDRSIRRILKAYLYQHSYKKRSHFKFYRNIQD